MEQIKSPTRKKSPIALEGMLLLRMLENKRCSWRREGVCHIIFVKVVHVVAHTTVRLKAWRLTLIGGVSG